MRMGDAPKTEASLFSALTALMSESEFCAVDFYQAHYYLFIY